MDPTIAVIVSRFVFGYLGIGLAFALIFLTLLVGRIDPAARGAGVVTRLLWLPGSILLWPLLIVRVWRSPSAIPAERTAHKLALRRRRADQ